MTKVRSLKAEKGGTDNELVLKVMFENEHLKKLFLMFFEQHALSIEQYLEVNYGREFGGDADPVIFVGKNSLGVQRFNKNKGAVIDSAGSVVDYANVKPGGLYVQFTQQGLSIFEKKSMTEKDRALGVAGSLDVAIEKMIEISKSSEGLDLALDAAINKI